MNAAFLPIVARELRLSSRRASTYWGRFSAALAALVPTGLLLMTSWMQWVTPAAWGAQAFRTLSFIALFYAMVAAVRLTSDCLSSEKRDGTLGLLFLTDLKPFDVVMGKLAATSLPGLYALLAIVPVMAIPVLSGGVTPGAVVRLAVVLVNTLFFSVALALLVSALCRQARVAAGMTMLLLVGVCTILPVTVAAVATSWGGGGAAAAVVGMFSPAFACFLVVEPAAAVSFPSLWWKSSTGLFWLSTVCTHGLGWMMVLACCRVLPRVWQDRPAGRRRMRWKERAQQILMGRPASRASFRSRLLAVNPIFWLGSRARRTWLYPWIFLFCMAVVLIASCRGLRVHGIDLGVVIVLAYALHIFFKHWVAVTASQAFAADRDQGALELLLSTPLRVEDMLRGHALTLRRLFLVPLLGLLFIEFMAWRIAMAQGQEASDMGRGWGTALLFVNGVVFVADVLALILVGWWMGATAKNAAQASSGTWVRVLLLPAGVTGALWMLFTFFLNLDGDDVRAFGLALYFVVSVVTDVLVASQARRSLHAELRLVAAERSAGGDSARRGWGNLGRRVGLWWAGGRRRTRAGSGGA